MGDYLLDFMHDFKSFNNLLHITTLREIYSISFNLWMREMDVFHLIRETG